MIGGESSSVGIVFYDTAQKGENAVENPGEKNSLPCHKRV